MGKKIIKDDRLVEDSWLLDWLPKALTLPVNQRQKIG